MYITTATQVRINIILPITYSLNSQESYYHPDHNYHSKLCKSMFRISVQTRHLSDARGLIYRIDLQKPDIMMDFLVLYCILGITEIWIFLAKKFTQKPAPQLHPATLTVLVRYNQAPKVPSV